VKVSVIERRYGPAGRSEKGERRDYRRGGVTKKGALRIQPKCPCV